MDSGDVRTVDVHVRRLREKIEPSPSDPKFVHTKWALVIISRRNKENRRKRKSVKITLVTVGKK